MEKQFRSDFRSFSEKLKFKFKLYGTYCKVGNYLLILSSYRITKEKFSLKLDNDKTWIGNSLRGKAKCV